MNSIMNSQSLFIKYEHITVIYESKFKITVNSFLVANSNFSIYEEDFANVSSESAINDDSQVISLKSNKNPHYFKNSKNLITYNDFISYGEDLVVEDTIKWSWTITENKKEILGYICQEATSTFRGRDYIAYFTAGLPFEIGPWKFHGLPGTILSVNSTDNALQIYARTIELKKENIEIKTPFELQKTISFQEFKMLYEKRYDKVTSFRYEDGTGIYMPKKRTEILIED